jgi:hypothetical protein
LLVGYNPFLSAGFSAVQVTALNGHCSKKQLPRDSFRVPKLISKSINTFRTEQTAIAANMMYSNFFFECNG